MTVLRELWYCHVAVLSFHASSSSNPPRFPCASPFLSDFRGQFWRSSGIQNGSCGISSESSRRPLSNDIKFASNRSSDEGVMAPGSRGVGAVFVHFSGVDSGQTGNAIGEPRVPRRSRSHYLSNAPGLADQLLPMSDFDVLGTVGKLALSYFGKVSDSRESELGLVRYGPASRVHRGVFGPFEGSFPIGIPAGPDKFLAIREFHVVHGCVLFPMCPGSQINLLRVRKTLCASAATSVGKFRNFQQNLTLSVLFSHAWPCTEASLGSRDMILRTEAVGMFLMPRAEVNLLPKGPWLADQVAAGQRESLRKRLPLQIGCFVNNTYQNLAKCRTVFSQFWPQLSRFSSRFRPVKYGIEALDILYTLVKGWSVRFQFLGLVNGPVKPWSNLVNLGQTWSNLVKALQTLGNVSRTSFQGFLGTVGPSRVGNGLVKPRSNFGQL
uniref:Uncharacterized protein n=1 Tax=Fagus sylvatica TaxID=28930 RepID=A0A2N9EI34_FAGSY